MDGTDAVADLRDSYTPPAQLRLCQDWHDRPDISIPGEELSARDRTDVVRGSTQGTARKPDSRRDLAPVILNPVTGGRMV